MFGALLEFPVPEYFQTNMGHHHGRKNHAAEGDHKKFLINHFQQDLRCPMDSIMDFSEGLFYTFVKEEGMYHYQQCFVDAYKMQTRIQLGIAEIWYAPDFKTVLQGLYRIYNNWSDIPDIYDECVTSKILGFD